MKDNNNRHPRSPKMRFRPTGHPAHGFTLTTLQSLTRLRAHPDDVEVILCRIQPRQHSHEQHIEEPAQPRPMLHMHHMMLETTLPGKYHRCPLYP